MPSQNHAEDHSETIRSLRRVRWAQVLVPLAIGLALLGTAVQSWVTVQRAATTVEMAQGRRLLRVVRRSLGPPLPATREQLERVLDMHEDLGLRCVAMPDEDGGPPVTAGDCKLSPEEVRRVLDDPPLLGVLRIDRNVGMIGGRPRWRRGFGAAPPGATRWARMRSVLIVFEPLEAHALQRSVTRSLIVALAALLVLIAAAIVLWRLSRRAEQLQEAAERDRRLATLGEMSAVLAHEIRNPLASLKGHAQLLLERLGDAGAPREKAERVVAEAQRLERLTEDLLSFVRSSQVIAGAGRSGALSCARPCATSIRRRSTSTPRRRRRAGGSTRSACVRCWSTCCATRSRHRPRARTPSPAWRARARRSASACATGARACPRATRSASSSRSTPRAPRAPGSASPSRGASSSCTAAPSPRTRIPRAAQSSAS